MKKLIILLMAALLLTCSAAATEGEFTLRNGVKFGMTEDEIMQLELAAGDAEELTPGSGTIVFKNREELTVAGRNEVTVVYDYDDTGAMCQMTYYFLFSPEADYRAVSNALLKKYGPTDYSSETNMKLPMIDPVIEDDNERVDTIQNPYTKGYVSQFSFEGTKSYSYRRDLRKFEMYDYNQWLIPYGDTHIMIEHSRVRDKFAKDSSVMASHYERIIYTLLSEEQNDVMMQQLEKDFSDL